MSEVGVIVTRHVREQLQKRDPTFADQQRDLAATIVYEVRRALADGRMAAHKPRWAHQRQGSVSRRSERQRASRFLTSADGQRCYVIRKAHRKTLHERVEEFAHTWLVVTVLVRPEERAA